MHPTMRKQERKSKRGCRPSLSLSCLLSVHIDRTPVLFTLLHSLSHLAPPAYSAALPAAIFVHPLLHLPAFLMPTPLFNVQYITICEVIMALPLYFLIQYTMNDESVNFRMNNTENVTNLWKKLSFLLKSIKSRVI